MMTNVLIKTARLKSLSQVGRQPTRPFYSWLIEVFNSKDEKRVKEIGADRAAGEWIIRNGGQVKFASSITLATNFTSLPFSKSPLIEIHAKDVALTNSGLRHLEGLEHLEWLDLNGCKHISDLSPLEEVMDTLKHLDIGNCAGLSDVSPVAKLTKLQKLVLTGTLGGEKRSGVIETLKKTLPDCEIVD